MAAAVVPHMSGLANGPAAADLLVLVSPRSSCDANSSDSDTDIDNRNRAALTAAGVTSAPVPMASASLTAASCAMTVLTAVERSVLRMLAFVFYQLDREQAKFCASSILHGYFQLQTQLPGYAVASLERVAESVIELSDAKFTSFWLSLLEKELEAGGSSSVAVAASAAAAGVVLPVSVTTTSSVTGGAELLVLGPPEARITIQSYDPSELRQAREKTLVRRLYQHIYCSIRSLFVAQRTSGGGHATQTPCTSPIDLADESHYQRQSRRRHSRCARFDDDDSNALGASRSSAQQSCGNESYADWRVDHDDNGGTGGADGDSESLYGDADSEYEYEYDDDDVFEPGWAVEYMEQESTVSSELTRRMRKMMHSSIPLNLFRVTVAYSCEARADAGADGFVGVISPDSFPPTPITRDLQTRRMNCYTARVLDHTTLALRLLETNSYSRTYQQLR